MIKFNNDKKYDPEERIFTYTKNAIDYVMNFPKKVACSEIGKQLARSAGSLNTNYLEANEVWRWKDFIRRIKICKKLAKELDYWLQ